MAEPYDVAMAVSALQRTWVTTHRSSAMRQGLRWAVFWNELAWSCRTGVRSYSRPFALCSRWVDIVLGSAVGTRVPRIGAESAVRLWCSKALGDERECPRLTIIMW